MKRIIVFSLLICMLVSMCACSIGKEPVPQTVPQTFDAKPFIDPMQVYVNGKGLSEVYKKNDTQYICLGELVTILGGSITTDATGKPPYTASITLEGKTFSISNEEEYLKEGEQQHPLVFEPLYDGQNWYVTMEPIMSLFNYHVFENTKTDTRYYTRLPSTTDIPDGKNIPTLMYHAVSDKMWGIAELFVSPAELEKQLKYLKENGFTTITFEDFDNLDKIEKPVLLTFDDGYDDNYHNLLPLLKKYNAKATVFVITGEIGKQNYMTEEQIKEMDASGLVSIQSHTVTHPFLANIPADQVTTELLESKRTIAKLTNKEPFVLCYPTGSISDTAVIEVEKHYSFGLLMNGGMYTTGEDDRYHIPRYYVSRFTTMDTFAANLQN